MSTKSAKTTKGVISRPRISGVKYSANASEFWLSNNSGKSKFMFPVLPEKITIIRDSDNETVNISGLGEVTIIQDPALKEFEFSSHFPATMHQGVQASIRKKNKLLAPQKYVDYIESFIASKKPAKFTVTSPQISMYCTIESFKYYEEGGDPGTFYYTIKLKEYREVTVRKLDKTPTKPTGSGGDGGSSGGGSGSGGKETSAGFDYGMVKTNGSRLPMYQKMSTSSKVVAKLPNGTYLKMISKTGKWYKVTAIIFKKTGYVKASYVKKANINPTGTPGIFHR